MNRLHPLASATYHLISDCPLFTRSTAAHLVLKCLADTPAGYQSRLAASTGETDMDSEWSPTDIGIAVAVVFLALWALLFFFGGVQ